MKFKIGDKICNLEKEFIGTIYKIEDDKLWCKDWKDMKTNKRKPGKLFLIKDHTMLLASYINEQKLRKALGLTDETT